jgi:two-component system chemotaxis response regulator CheB
MAKSLRASKRDIVVIGGSAGSIEFLRRIVSLLPEDFSAALFVALHIYARGPSLLPEILSRSGPLQARHPVDGEPIRHGTIHVAPPNQHLLIEGNHIRLSTGPMENGHRPAVNPMFRSAAFAHGSRVIGVVLSGNMDDGTTGLWEIKRRGGVAMVQHPSEASYPGMPSSALANVPVDFTLTAEGLAERLRRLCAEPTPRTVRKVREQMQPQPVPWTCPECRGPLQELRTGNVRELRCRVGHTFSGKSFLEAHTNTVERSLWGAVVAVEEGIEMEEAIRPEGKNLQNIDRAIKTKRSIAKRLREMIGEFNSAESQGPSKRRKPGRI